MALTILNTIIDEEFRPIQTGTGDDNDVSSATFDASSFKTALNALSLTPFATANGFPQYAEMTNFVSSSNQVTNYFLTSSATGTAFPATGTPTDLYVGTNRIFLFPAINNTDLVIGRLGNGANADPNGAVALVIGLEETRNTSGVVTAADMWIAQYAPLVHSRVNLFDAADELNLANLVWLGSTYDTSSESTFKDFSKVPSGNNLFNVIFQTPTAEVPIPPDVQLLVTGSKEETLGTVNVSTQGIGANAQSVAKGATLRIDTVSGMTQANVNDPPEVNQSGNIDYVDRVELIKANFEITQTNANGKQADLLITAFNAALKPQEGAYLTDLINADGVAVIIDAEDVRILNANGVDITAVWQNRAGTDITQSGAGVIVTGLLEGDRVSFSTDGEKFDRFLITNVDTKETFDVGNINVTSLVGGSATEFEESGAELRFQDDAPVITADPSTTASVTHDETAGVQSDTDKAGSDPISMGGAATIASLFTGVGATAIGFARSVSPLVTVTASDSGADGAASQQLAYSLSVTAGTASGVSTTGGTNIFMYNGAAGTALAGLVLGRVGTERGASADTADASGAIAFALAVNTMSGEVFLSQYLSLLHPVTGSTTAAFDDPISLNSGAVQMSVRLTDGDGDFDTDTGNNIGQLIKFEDDGPAITASTNASKPNNLVVKNLPDVAAGTDDSFYVLAPGADGQMSLVFKGPEVTTGELQWRFFDWDGQDGAEANEIKGTFVRTIDGVTTTTDLYKLVINADGTYSFDLLNELPGSKLDLDVNSIKAGGPDSNSIIVGALNDSAGRSIEIAASGGPINESNDNVGVTNGNLDVGETLTFKLLDSSGAPIDFQGISIGTKTASGGTYTYLARSADDPTVFYPGEVTVEKNETIVINDLPGLVDQITLSKSSGSTTKIGLDNIDIFLPPNDVSITFGVRLTDGDGDFADQSFTVTIDGNNDNTPSSAALIEPGDADLAAMLNPFELQHQDYFLV